MEPYGTVDGADVAMLLVLLQRCTFGSTTPCALSPAPLPRCVKERPWARRFCHVFGVQDWWRS